MANNEETFCAILSSHYTDLFKTEEYAMAARRYTPQSMAAKMVQGLKDGTANKDGDGIKRTCRDVGIKHTYKAILEYLST